MKKKLFLIAVAALTSAVLAEAGGWEFTVVTVVQRWPWSRKVDIDFRARQTDGQASRRHTARVAVKLGDRTLAADPLRNVVVPSFTRRSPDGGDGMQRNAMCVVV